MYISRIFWYGIIPFISHMVTYWGTSYLFAFLDSYVIHKNKHKDWKIQPNSLPSNLPEYKKYFIKIAKPILHFQIHYLLPLAFVFGCIAPELYHTGSETLYSLIYKSIGIILIEEFLFYHLHRLFHHKLLYKYHKMHHSIHAPIAVSTIYCHPLENIFVNIGPLLVGPYIMGLSWYWTQWWMPIATINAIFGHTGYNWSFFKSQAHDDHHKYFKCNYGTLGLFDKLYKTNK